MIKKIGLIVLVLVINANVFAGYVTWTGAVSDDWSVPENWNTYWVPDTGDVVTIPDDSNCVIYPGTHVVVKDLTIDANMYGTAKDAKLTIKSGASLTISTWNFEMGYTFCTTAKSILNIESDAVVDLTTADPAYGNFLHYSRLGLRHVNLAGTIKVKANRFGYDRTKPNVVNFTERTGKIIIGSNEYIDTWYINFWCRYWLDRGVASGILEDNIIPEWGVTYGFVAEYDGATDTTTFKSVKYVENAKAPMDPQPADEAIDITVTPILSWSAPLKSSGDALTYKVYLSTNPSAMGTGVNVGSATSYDPTGNLLSETAYYWRVDVTDANFGNPVTITGDVWTFDTTMAGAAVLASPADTDSPEVATNITLNWTSDPAATSHLVYLRERNGTWALVSTINAPAATTYTPALLYGKAYDWRVDEVFPGPVTVPGPTWKFHTITPVCNGGLRFAGDEDGDCDVDFEDFAAIATNWMTCAFEPAAACGNF